MLRKRIRQAMRLNEAQVLAHLRRHRVWSTALFGRSWYNALDRLEAKGMVRFHNGVYMVRKYARPVTKEA